MPYPNWDANDALVAQKAGNEPLAQAIMKYVAGLGPAPGPNGELPSTTPTTPTTPAVQTYTSAPLPTSNDPMAWLKWAIDDANARGANAENASILATETLKAILPYLTASQQAAAQQAMAAAQAQAATTSATAGIQIAGIQAAASQANAATAAAAQIKAQEIAVAGQLEGIDRQIKADLQRLILGETGAAQRLQAELGQRAELANQATALQVELARMGDRSAAQRLQAQLALTAQQTNAQIQSEYQRALLGEAGANQRLQAQLGIQATIASATFKVDLQKTLMGEMGAAQRLEAQLRFTAEQTNAQIMGNLQGVLMGETGATQRLQAQLDVEAQKTNQAMRMEVAKLASSTGLRDALASRLFVRGLGDQPAVGSSALAGTFQEVQAPKIPLPQLGWSPNVQAPTVTMPNFGNFQAPEIPVPTVGLPPSLGALPRVTAPTVPTPTYDWQPYWINPPIVPLPVAPPSTPGTTTELSPVTGANVSPALNPSVGVTGSGVAGSPDTEPPAYIGIGAGRMPNPAYAIWKQEQESLRLGYNPNTNISQMTPQELQAMQRGQLSALASYNQKYGYQGLPSLAGGTTNAGSAYLVGDGAGVIPGVTEVLQVDTQGKLKQVIPLAGTAQEGVPAGWSNVTKQGATKGTSWWQGPAGGEQLWREGTPAPWEPTIPPALAPTNPTPPPASSTTGGITAGNLPAWLTPLMPLADAANIPALVAARTGKAPPAFQQYGGPIDIGFGMGSIPEPREVASVYGKLDPWMREDILQAYEMAGLPRDFVQWQMAQATPGFRFNPQRPFSFT